MYIERYKEQLGLVKPPFHQLQLDKIIIGDNILFTLNTMTVKVGNLIMLSYLNLLLCPVPRGYWRVGALGRGNGFRKKYFPIRK